MFSATDIWATGYGPYVLVVSPWVIYFIFLGLRLLVCKTALARGKDEGPVVREDEACSFGTPSPGLSLWQREVPSVSK